MKAYRQFHRSLIAILCCLILLTGCGGSGTDPALTYRVYYLDSESQKLVSEDYEITPGTKQTEDIATELIHALEKNGEKGRFVNPIEPDIEFDELHLRNNQLSIYFTGAYNNKTGLVEVLSRAAIVKTMCQLPGVDKVDFYVEDQSLMVRGENVGIMDQTTFVDDLGNQGKPQSRKVRLYFSDKSGEKLVSVDTEVTYPAAEKMAKLLVEQLIAGPEAIKEPDCSDLVRTIPNGTLLNSVTIRDNICYLDLSREFAELLPDVTSDATIYSIVDTLCELPSISRVQFTINSSFRERYGETDGFNKPLERNLDIISGNSTPH